MRKNQILFVILLGFCGFLKAQIPEDNLVAWYPFNGNCHDESMNSYNGLVNGAELTSDRFGNPNSAYQFDGVNDFIHLPVPNVGEQDGIVSWAVWINPSSQNTPDPVEDFFQIFHAASLQLQSGGLRAGMEIGTGDRNYIYDTINNYKDDQWHFLVLSYDDEYMRFFINGEIIDSVYDGNGQIDYNGVLGIYLGMSGFIENYFIGKIDDIRIYNKTLTHEEVEVLYYEGLSVTDFNSDANYACLNQLISLEPDTTNTSPDSLLWLFPGGSPETSTALFATVAYDTEGSYDVTLTSWKNDLEYVITKEAYIHVFAVPVQPDVPSGQEIVCHNTQNSTYLTTNASSIWQVEPTYAGTISYTDSICTVSWNDTFFGEAELRVKIFNGCGEGEFSDPLIIQRMEPSGVDFNASQTLLVEKPYTIAFTNLTPNMEDYTFLWDFGNGETSTLTEPEYTYPESGEYSVTLTATHQAEGCVDSIYKEEYIFCSGVGINSPDRKGFSYRFNQQNQVLSISFTKHPGSAKISIYDIQGKLCHQAEINSIKTSISMEKFKPGYYIFSIFEEKTNWSGKIFSKPYQSN